MFLQQVLKILKEEFEKSHLKKYLYGALLYGSLAREEDFIPGWSDCDVLFVPNYDFCCPRDFYNELGHWYANVRERIEYKKVKWGIEDEIDVSVYDKGSVKSGRFCWMITNFKDHLRKSGKVFFGNDVRDILSNEKPKTDEEYSMAYGLWRTRITASSLNYYRRHDKKSFKYEFKKSIKALGNFCRNAVILVQPLKNDAKSKILQQFVDLFPEIKLEDIRKIMEIPQKWPSLDEEEMTELFFKGLEIREEVVKALVNKKI